MYVYVYPLAGPDIHAGSKESYIIIIFANLSSIRINWGQLVTYSLALLTVWDRE